MHHPGWKRDFLLRLPALITKDLLEMLHLVDQRMVCRFKGQKYSVFLNYEYNLNQGSVVCKSFELPCQEMLPLAEKVQLNYLLKANSQVTRQVKVITRRQFKQANKSNKGKQANKSSHCGLEILDHDL